MVSFRPRNLAEVIAARGADFWLPLDEFLDEFYLAYPDRVEMGRMIAVEPPVLGDEFLDAYLASVAEHLAIRWNLRIPGWVENVARLGGDFPSFVPDLETLHGLQLVESPYAFRRRNIFTIEEPLQRARWPRDVPVYEPLGPSF